MPGNYSASRYKKSTRIGRKPLPVDKQRKTISLRVAPATYRYLAERGLKAGREVDRLVRRVIEEESGPKEPSSETSQDEARDTIMESARGLVALIAERGTEHLSQEQIAVLDDNFTLLVNNYLATFKRKSESSSSD
ncbi:MAG: hypothetical protein AB1489_32150 [Acidobacteriota bacterium]